MAIWTLGRVPAGEVVVEAQSSTLEKFVGKVLKWVPADLAVIYTGFIKALVDSPDDDPNVRLTVVFIVLAPIAVLLVSFSSGDRGVKGRALAARVVLAAPALAIWSGTVPNSGWDQIEWVAENPAWTVGIAAVAGFFFSLIADGIESRVK